MDIYLSRPELLNPKDPLLDIIFEPETNPNLKSKICNSKIKSKYFLSNIICELDLETNESNVNLDIFIQAFYVYLNT